MPMEAFQNKFKILVRTNAKENKLECFDKEKGVYRLDIKARPENNKANVEIIKFFSKMLKKEVMIASGYKSRENTIKVLE